MRLKIAVFTVVSLLAACYLLSGLLGIQAHNDPGEMDTTAYLSAACQIHDTGGIAHHIQNCVQGIYREATQHPGYLLVLSVFAERSVHFFVHAKWASYWIGFIFLFVYFFTVRDLLGRSSALIALCFVVWAATFINLSTMVACESLLVLFFILFWLCSSKGFASGSWWLGAGFFASCAFLTKSIAILTLPIFLFSALFLKGWRVFRNKYFWGFFAVFILVASPIFLRNIKVYGTPLYSDSSAVLWIDHWHDYYRADILEHPPTLGAYLKTHSPLDIIAIFLTGLFGRDAKMISDGLKPLAFWENPIKIETLQGFYARTVFWQGLWSSIICILSLFGLWKYRKSPPAVVAAVGLILFLVFVAWYSKVFPGLPPTRLLYPVIFFIFAFSAAIIARIPKSWVLGLAGGFSLVYLFFLGTHFDWRRLSIEKSYSFGNPFVAELFWVDHHVAAGESVMAGTVFMSYYFYFETKIRGKVLQWPQVDSIQELTSYAKSKSIRYGILDLSTVAYDMKAYHEFFEVGPHIGLKPKLDLPAPFSPVYKDPNHPPLYEIYELRNS